MLKQQNVPYLFVIIVSLFTWSLSTLVENTKLSPIVEYKITSSPDRNKQLRLINLSSSNNIKDIELKYCSLDSIENCEDIFSHVTVIAAPPAYVVQKRISRTNISGRCFNFTLDQFQPGNEFRIIYNSSSKAENTLRLIKTNGTAVRLIPENVLTFMVKNQDQFLSCSFIASLIILALYSFYLNKNVTK